MARAFVFPGQGAQYVGMGMELAERYPEARAVLDEADAVLGYGLSDLIAHGPDDELTRTDRSQPAILTVSWMAHAVLQRQVPINTCSATAGLSLGEYTALLAAGVFDFADALRLVQVRGEAMQAAAEAEPSGMVALIGTDEAGAAALCAAVRQDEGLTVANLNSPGQGVISGSRAACDGAPCTTSRSCSRVSRIRRQISRKSGSSSGRRSSSPLSPDHGRVQPRARPPEVAKPCSSRRCSTEASRIGTSRRKRRLQPRESARPDSARLPKPPFMRAMP